MIDHCVKIDIQGFVEVSYLFDHAFGEGRKLLSPTYFTSIFVYLCLCSENDA